MELNIKEQTEKLQGEQAKLQQRLQQIEQARNNVIIAIAKKQGAIEHLQSLNGDKPDGKAV